MGWLNGLVNGFGLGYNQSDSASAIASTALMTAGAGTGNPALMMAGAQMNQANSAQAAIDAQKEANAQNISFQRETNDQSIELANTAHQREIKDLAAAGLNPILSAKYGGSSTPSLGSPAMASLAPVIQNSAKQSADITSSDVGFRLAANLQSSQTAANSAQAVKTILEAERIKMENEVAAAKLPNAKFEAEYRNSRPRSVKGFGIDWSDIFGTVGKVFGANVNVK